jgi:hypothetical protein
MRVPQPTTHWSTVGDLRLSMNPYILHTPRRHRTANLAILSSDFALFLRKFNYLNGTRPRAPFHHQRQAGVVRGSVSLGILPGSSEFLKIDLDSLFPHGDSASESTWALVDNSAYKLNMEDLDGILQNKFGKSKIITSFVAQWLKIDACILGIEELNNQYCNLFSDQKTKRVRVKNPLVKHKCNISLYTPSPPFSSIFIL